MSTCVTAVRLSSLSSSACFCKLFGYGDIRGAQDGVVHIPTPTGPGVVTVAMLHLLVRVHNDFIEKSRAVLKMK